MVPGAFAAILLPLCAEFPCARRRVRGQSRFEMVGEVTCWGRSFITCRREIDASVCLEIVEVLSRFKTQCRPFLVACLFKLFAFPFALALFLIIEWMPGPSLHHFSRPLGEALQQLYRRGKSRQSYLPTGMEAPVSRSLGSSHLQVNSSVLLSNALDGLAWAEMGGSPWGSIPGLVALVAPNFNAHHSHNFLGVAFQ